MKGIVGNFNLGYRESVKGGSRCLRVIPEDHPGAVNLKYIKVYWLYDLFYIDESLNGAMQVRLNGNGPVIVLRYKPYGRI